MNSKVSYVLKWLEGESPSSPVFSSWTLSRSGGKLGRSDECDWVLPDTQRIISRVHASIQWQGNRFVWTDLGVNASVINGERLEQGFPFPLNHGDRIVVGNHHLCFEVSHHAEPAQDFLSLTPKQPPSVIPDNLDFLKAPELKIDDLLSSQSDVIEQMSLPSLDTSPMSEVFEMRFAAPLSSNSPVPDSLPSAQSQQAIRSTKVLPEAQPLQPKPLEQQNLGSLIQALGLPAGTVLSDSQLSLIGSMLRTCLSGYLELLKARKVFRHELGASVTEILITQNNPMKFSADVDELIDRFFMRERPGYLGPREAIEATIEDLTEHNTAAISGLQSALSEALHQLDPEQIKGKHTQARFVWQKAKLWDHYCQRYAHIGEKRVDPVSRLIAESMRKAMQDTE